MIAPGTGLGRWSVGLIVVFAAGLSFFAVAVSAGQRGGQGFFDNLWLTVPILVAFAAAVGAMITGLVAVIGRQERALPVFLAVVVGAAVTLFGVLELAMPH